MSKRSRLSLALAALLLGACKTMGGADVDPPRPDIVTPVDAKKLFAEAIEDFSARQRSDTWTRASCDQLSEDFERAARSNADLAIQGLYNAGVVRHRCGDTAAAEQHYRDVLEKDPAFHLARLQLVRIEMERSGPKALDKSILELERAVLDAKYTNVDALVELARLQMQRKGTTNDSDGADDMTRAKKNLMRALAQDDGSAPAINQLALYYLTVAKTASHKARAETYDLALVVASQGMKKAPSYAPLQNTMGVIYVELGDLTNASKRFSRARELDSRFFDAHMNFASVNMLFRGFAKAEGAYRTALAVRPKDYDALLGLAVARRAQLDREAEGSELEEVESLLAQAKAVAPDRPEAYFNHGVFLADTRGRQAGEAGRKALAEAIDMYTTFLKKAAGKPEFAAQMEDVSAIPTKPEEECLAFEAKDDAACRRGRIYDLKELIAFSLGG